MGVVFNSFYSKTSSLQRFLLQLLNVVVDATDFARNLDLLGAMAGALVAAYAMAGLTKAWHAAIVAHKEGTALLAIGW